MKRYIATPVIFLYAILVAACEPLQPQTVVASKPQSWIDAPLDGSALPLAPVDVVSHSSDSNSVAVVQLSVNGIVVQSDANLDTTKTLVTMSQSWTPQTPGNYTLLVRAQNSAGVWGDYAQAVVTVQGAAATATRTLTATPMPASPTRPVATTTPPLPVRTPSNTLVPATRTFTPAPPTVTPSVGCVGTPVISSFNATPSSIFLGGSSTLSWGPVTNADSVEIDQAIGGVATPGSIVVSPSVTAVYTLTARCKGVVVIQRTVVMVSASPPPIFFVTPTNTPVGR